jgi:YfiH family protein
MLDPVLADWDAPPNVHACTTTRIGGVSAAPFQSLNLATHVGDAPEAVAANRKRVAEALRLPSSPCWLEQVHGPAVTVVDGCGETTPVADAGIATEPGRVCVVLTADCLPVLFCDRAGSVCAAAHAGWRGLHRGVLEATVARLNTDPTRLLAWLGPAIGPARFEVGPEVRAAFIEQDAAARGAFRRGNADRWLCDIYHLARLRLAAAGVAAVTGGAACTVSDETRFFSYRRDGRTGRMASLVWIDPGREAG